MLWRYGIFLVVLALLTTGCVQMADPETAQPLFPQPIVQFGAGITTGQSFVPLRPDLSGITLWLAPTAYPLASSDLTGVLEIFLFHTPQDSTAFFEARYEISKLFSGPEVIPLSLSLPNLKAPAGQSYYLLLKCQDCRLQAYGRSETGYTQGQAFVNGLPVPGDLAFTTTYTYGPQAILADLSRELGRAWLAFPLALVVFFPGWLIVSLTGLQARMDPLERSALALGISLACIPLLFLWLPPGWRISPTIYLLLLGVLALLAAYRHWRQRQTQLLLKQGMRLKPEYQNDLLPPAYPLPSRLPKGQHLAFWILFLLVLAVRLAMTRDLATPAWVDPVHHAVIANLIATTGRFPETFAPYINVPSSVYHAGFHASIAVFGWLSGLRVDQALLYSGQVLNALSIFGVYLFVKSITQRSRAGLIAALVAGLITPMPAYYTSWGRYTHLVGLLILPAVIALLRLAQQEKSSRLRWWALLLSGLTAAGLFLVHSRVAILMACWLLPWAVSQIKFHIQRLPRRIEIDPRPFLHSISSVAVVGLLASLIALPWLIPVLTQMVLPKIQAGAAGKADWFADFSWRYLNNGLGRHTVWLGGLGITLALVQRKTFAFSILAWIGLMLLAANLGALGLPAIAWVNNTSVAISLYLPISLAIGHLFDQALMWGEKALPEGWRFTSPMRIGLNGLVILLATISGLAGARSLLTILNPVTILSRQADLPAIEWIRLNLPEDETILISPFAWGYGIYAGSDGGYWISSLAERRTIPAPVLYSSSPERKQINEISQAAIQRAADPQALWELMRSNDLRYLFSGGRDPVFFPEKYLASGWFTARYHQDGVWVLEANPGHAP